MQGTSLKPARTAGITIRSERPEDEPALTRLAQLDSAHTPPPRPLLLAEIEGELRVALSLRDGSVIADPFHLTQATLELLRAHARQTTTQRRPVQRRAAIAAARGLRTGRRTPAWAR
jgi:hypothetical protein